MPDELRTVCYDADLRIEAYRFQGLMQKFPHHFHDYYVIGFIESGRRYMQCNNKSYIINPGDIILFNPRAQCRSWQRAVGALFAGNSNDKRPILGKMEAKSSHFQGGFFCAFKFNL